MSSLEMRLKNAIEEGDKWPNGNALPRIGAREVLQALKEHPISSQPLGPNEGRGYAIGGWPGGALPGFSARVVRIQMPDRFAFPSAVRGAGAVRFNLPSAPFGTPGAGRSAHCAAVNAG